MARLFSYQYRAPELESLKDWVFNGYRQSRWDSLSETPIRCYKSDANGVPVPLYVWTTGRLAHDAMTLHKESHRESTPAIEWRVMPVESSELTTSDDGIPLDQYLQAKLNWPAREQARFDSGEYVPLPWAGQDWFDVPHARLKHFAHVSKQNPRRITFTDGESAGIADRQASPMNPGRYFTRFATDYGLTPARIAELSVEYSTVHGACDDFELRFASTPDEIVAAYTSGDANAHGQHSPTSCMSYSARHFGGLHPVMVYGAGDLQCAYLVDKRQSEERITARSIVWPAKQKYSRIYGDEARLSDLLVGLGYRESSEFDGARLLAKQDNHGEYVMPYLDFNGQSVSMETDGDGKEYFVIDRRGDYNCGSTSGRIYCSRCTCDNCGDGIDEEEVYSLDDMSLCCSCYEELTVRCDHCGVSEHRDSNDFVEQANGDNWCENCDSRYFTCDHSGHVSRRRDNNGVSNIGLSYENDDGFEVHISRQHAGLYFTCCETNAILLRAESLAGFIGTGDDRPISHDGLDALRESDPAELEMFESVAGREERVTRQLEFDLASAHASNPTAIAWTPEMPVPDVSPDAKAVWDSAETMARDMSNGLDHESRVIMLRNVGNYRAQCVAFLAMRARAQATLESYRQTYETV